MAHPKTLLEFMQLYPTEEDCRRAIFGHRWPYGFSCRRCGQERTWYLRDRGLYGCASCRLLDRSVGQPEGGLLKTAGTYAPARPATTMRAEGRTHVVDSAGR